MPKRKKRARVPYLQVPADVAVRVRILYMNGAPPGYIELSTGVKPDMQDMLKSLRVMQGKEFLPPGYKFYLASRGISHTV